MNKNAKIVLIIGALAVSGYLFWRWYQNRQAAATGQGAVSQLGTNLNSLAPELVGGSSGPSSGPQVTMPVTITLTDQGTQQPPVDNGPNQMQPTNVPPLSPMTQDAVTGAGSAGDNEDVTPPEPMGAASVGSPGDNDTGQG